MKKPLLLLALFVAAVGVGPAAAQVAIESLPDEVVVHRGVYRYADQQWLPGEPAAQKTTATLFDNTTGTGGFQPTNQLPGVNVPATFLDWATSEGGVVKGIGISYATDATEVQAEVSLYTGTTDAADGIRIFSISLDLPGSQSGNIEVFETTVDVSEEAPYLPPGPFGAALTVSEEGTGWLTATGGTGITDFYRLLGEQVNRTVDGFFAQFYLRLEGDPVTVRYVDNAAPGGGDGSRAAPFNTTAEVEAASGPGDVIVLLTGTGPYDHIALQDGQRIYTEGATFGDIPAGDRPTIGGLTLNDDVEVNDVNVDGGSVEADGVTGQIQVNRTIITSESGGINIRGSAATFTFTETDVNGVLVGGGSADLTFDEKSKINPGPDGLAVRIDGGHTGTVTVTGEHRGGGLRFDDADGAYCFERGVFLPGDSTGFNILAPSRGLFKVRRLEIDRDPLTDPDTPPVGLLNGEIEIDTLKIRARKGAEVKGEERPVTFGRVDIELTGEPGNDCLRFEDTDVVHVLTDDMVCENGNVGVQGGNISLNTRALTLRSGSMIIDDAALTGTIEKLLFDDPDSTALIARRSLLKLNIPDSFKVKKGRGGVRIKGPLEELFELEFGVVDVEREDDADDPCISVEDFGGERAPSVFFEFNRDGFCDGGLAIRDVANGDFRFKGSMEFHTKPDEPCQVMTRSIITSEIEARAFCKGGGIFINNSTISSTTGEITLQGSGGDGFRIDRSTVDLQSGKVTIEDVEEDAIRLIRADSSKIRFDSLTVARVRAGFRADSLDGLTLFLEKLAIFDNRGPCLEMNHVNRSTVEIDESECAPEAGRHGYFIHRNLESTYKVRVSNLSLGGGGDGLHVLDSGINFQFGELFVDVAQYGVNIDGNDGAIEINGGEIRNVEENGVLAHDFESLTIENLLLEDIGGSCVLSWGRPGSQLTGRNVACEYKLRAREPTIVTGWSWATTVSGLPKSGGNARSTARLVIDSLTVSNADRDALVVTTDETVTADVIITNSTLDTTGDNGITVQTTGSSAALVTLSGNTVTAATNDFALSQQDNSTFLLTGFDGGDAAAFIQANNEGSPSVVVNGTIGAGPASGTADLRLVEKTVSDRSPTVGDTLVYTIRTTNAGPAAASAVIVSDLLPAGLTYLPGTITLNEQAQSDAAGDDEADFGGTAANTITVTAATLAVGDTLVVAFQARVDADGTTITNTATVTGAESDALGGNNDASVAIDVGIPTALEATEGVPETFALFQNYPNPFNPVTTIRYATPTPGRVHLAVFDMLGRRVAVLVDEQQAAGQYEVRFDAQGLPSGAYIYRMTGDGFTQTRKLILLK